MTGPRTLTLHGRLSRLIAFCVGLTALLGMLVVAGAGLWALGAHAREETTEIGRTMSFALQAPVAFGDQRGIADALALLRARPQVSGAWVYDRAGRLVGHYGEDPPVATDAPPRGFLSGSLLGRDPIIVDGTPVGQVILVNQLDELWTAMAAALLAMAAGSVAGIVVSVLLAQRIARAIARPITSLAEAAAEIATHHDYTRQLPAAGHDEVGTAVAAFNGMLDEIRRRGAALQAANLALEQRVAERTDALLREKERAEAASITKTRFLANMSHELRTPLNAVIGAAQLLEDGGGSADRQAYLINAIRSGGTKLLGQIEGVLDLSRIETGALTLASEDFNLFDCVEAAMATAAVAAHSRGLEIACTLDPQVAAWRRGDPTRLRQVLLNVLGNAVKFTLQGEVVLRLQRGPGPDDLRIRVSDTGVGIAASSLAQVFEPFQQADDQASRRFSGSGLGLAISRQLLDAMGGRISVQSEPGRGSIFEIELALAPAAKAGAASPRLGQAVLFFEPHEPSAEALAANLASLGCTAQRCRSAADLEQWMTAHGDIATAPWLLARVDAEGSEAFLEAAVPRVGRRRVIGISRGDSAMATAALERHRIVRDLVKPILRTTLIACFGNPTRAATPAAPSDTGHRPARKRILVVEDDMVNHTIVCRMLENAGYDAAVAADGASAIDQLSRQAFDLVLMDWQMPDMDGLEVTRRLRGGAAGERGKVVPIVALTANAFAEDRSACLAAGMNDFLSKPVLAAALQTTVAHWLAAEEAAVLSLP